MTIEKNEIQKKRSSNEVERVARDEQSCKKATYDRSVEASHHPLPQPSPIPYHPSLPAAQHGASGGMKESSRSVSRSPKNTSRGDSDLNIEEY